MSARYELQRRTQYRSRIDAAMNTETFVLIRKKHIEEARIDVGDRRQQPPAAFAGRISAQQTPFPIDHAGREIEVLAERRRTERSDPAHRAGKGRRAYESAGENEAHFLTHHFAAVTSMLPLPVRP